MTPLKPAALTGSKQILIVDDDDDITRLYQKKLHTLGHEVRAASTISAMRQVLAQQEPFLILLDIYLKEGSTLKYVKEIKESYPRSQIVILTGKGSEAQAVRALSDGAAGFLSKASPFAYNVHLIQQLLSESGGTASADPNIDSQIVVMGDSKEAQSLRQSVRKLRNIDTPVTIIGEYGSGKESLARTIHSQSLRASHPFLTVRCAQRSEETLQRELFGISGSFQQDFSGKGRLEMAANGTLLIEEIDYLPLTLQSRLSNDLERLPTHTNSITKAPPRIIVTTRHDLKRMVKTGDFSKELYRKLSWIRIETPPLRNRKEDIGLLTKALLKQANLRHRKRTLSPSKHTIYQMKKYDWPGNLRELKSAIERAIILTPENKAITGEHLLPYHKSRLTRSAGRSPRDKLMDLPINFAEARELFERTYLKRLLDHSGGRVTEAARLSGENRSFLYRLIEKYRAPSNEDNHLGNNLHETI